jgi:hypothetical protein
MRLLAAGGDRMVTLPKKEGLPEERPAADGHRAGPIGSPADAGHAQASQ